MNKTDLINTAISSVVGASAIAAAAGVVSAAVVGGKRVYKFCKNYQTPKAKAEAQKRAREAMMRVR